MAFRRTTPQIRNEGGLWDTSMRMYPLCGGSPREQTLTWKWKSGASLSMSHLQYDNTVLDWQGSQIPLILFDELTHFSARQFWYMLSRNRSDTAGVRPYVRAGTNPSKKSFVRHLIDWWIGEDGFPIYSRSGKIRYFFRDEDKLIWVRPDARDRFGNAPKSITFIPSRLSDNPTLCKRDPGYAANLAAQDRAERMRLLEGNWDVDDSGGMFDPEWFIIEVRVPAHIELRIIRYWDRAASEVSAKNPDPDWTAGALVGIDQFGELWILDMIHFRGEPLENERRIKNAADNDGHDIPILIEQEPGSAGKDVFSHYQTRVLAGFTVRNDRPTGSKVDRARPWAALAENRKVHVLAGKWNAPFLAEAKNFPNGKKDQIDAVSGAYACHFEPVEIGGVNIHY